MCLAPLRARGFARGFGVRIATAGVALLVGSESITSRAPRIRSAQTWQCFRAESRMDRVEVVPIALPGDAKAFVDTWFRIYRGNPHWVPPLRFERKRFFDPGVNPYFAGADVQCFIAKRGANAVGTISATVDHEYQRHDPGAGFFGFFEFVDDLDVAQALYDAACDWLRGRGMQRALGPFNFTTNHEFGLLVDGFDSDPLILNPYNAAYFPPIYEKLGLVKAMDWYAYWLDDSAGDGAPARISRLSQRFLKRHPEVKLRPVDPKNFWQEAETLHDIYDDAWEQNWGHVKMSDDEFNYVAAGFKQILVPRLCWVVEIAGEPAALSLTLPDMNQVAKKMNGRLLPFGWFHFLFGRRRVDQVRIFMLGVKQKFQHLPLGAALYAKTWEEGLALGYKQGEASLILENNQRMRRALEKMGARVYKTYRTYEAQL
jgi:GNAT superfamily N-acetyltransferase